MKVHSFDKVAFDYTQKVSPHRHSQFLALLHEMRFKGNETVLDIGCGPGVLSLEAASKLPEGRLVGIDVAEGMIKLARRLALEQSVGNAEFKTGDAMTLDFEENNFDAVISSNAFPWVDNQEQFLTELFRVMKPNGRMGLVSLSRIVYREFIEALLHTAKRNNKLRHLANDVYKSMKFRPFDIAELTDVVTKSGLIVDHAFQLSTEEPISPRDYVRRVNAIVDENYLDGLSELEQRIARNEILLSLARENGELNITESSIFIIAHKPS